MNLQSKIMILLAVQISFMSPFVYALPIVTASSAETATLSAAPPSTASTSYSSFGPASMGVTPAYTTTLAAAYMSAPGPMVDANPSLKACINGTTQYSCNQNMHPLRLFQGNSNVEITGFYDSKGKKCKTGTTDCTFSVNATFTATCAPDSSGVPQTTCKKPASFKIDYYVEEYNVPKGTQPLAMVSTGTNGGRISPIIPYSAIYSQEYSKTNCGALYPQKDANGVIITVDGQPLKDDKSNALAELAHSNVIGSDAYGQVICGPDPNQGTIDTMKTKLCEIETAQVDTSGGQTTTCPVVHTVIKLVGGAHLASDCSASSGTLVDLSGATVANPTVANNQKLFCKFTGASCPATWVKREFWSKTQKKCARPIVHNAGGDHGGCWGSEGQPLADSIQSTCTLEHQNFLNVETEHTMVAEYSENMPCNGSSCDCGYGSGGFKDNIANQCGSAPYFYLRWQDGSGSGNNRWYACQAWWNQPNTPLTADVTQIGCN